MGVPATTGQLRTKVSEMEIGDYIKIQGSAGSPSTSLKLGEGVTFTNECSVTGVQYNVANNVYWYMVKAAKGLLVSDRVFTHTITWDAMNSLKIIQGAPFDTGNIIPTMTSNTSPSGVVSASSEEVANIARNTFDKSTATYWAATAIPAWIAYEFNFQTKVQMYSITPHTNATTAPKDWTFEGWDGLQWIILDEKKNETAWTASTKRNFPISNVKPFLKYRLNITAVGSGGILRISEFEMFDTVGIIRSLTGGVAYIGTTGANIIPTMTSNTSPSGVVSSNGEYDSDSGAWKAFEANTGATNRWNASAGNSAWIQYDFGQGNEKNIKKYRITSGSTPSAAPKSWTFEASNTGNFSGEQVVLDSRTNQTGWATTTPRGFDMVHSEKYRYYRLNITENNGVATAGIYFTEIDYIEMFDKLDFISSTTDQGLGGWPTNNEWDRFIVNFPKDKIQAGKTLDDVFHWSGAKTWTQDTSVSAGARTARGKESVNSVATGVGSSNATTLYGFRPVFEYQE